MTQSVKMDAMKVLSLATNAIEKVKKIASSDGGGGSPEDSGASVETDGPPSIPRV